MSAFRLVEEQGSDSSADRLNKDLKTLAKQAKATKYREVMKLLRLVLSGLQVSEHGIYYIYKLTDRLVPQQVCQYIESHTHPTRGRVTKLFDKTQPLPPET